MKREANFSGFIGECFALLRDGLQTVLPLLVLMTFLGAIGTYFQGSGISTGFDFHIGPRIDSALLQKGPLAVIAVTASFVLGFVIQYFLYCYLLEQRGYPNRENRLAKYIGFSILYIVGVVVGFVLLLVPGFIVMTRWVAAPSLVVGTKTPVMEAFSESWDITSGKSWPIFGGLLVLPIGITIFSALFLAPTLAFLGEDSVGMIILSSLSQQIVTVVMTAFSVGVFYLLHDSGEQLADVFE